MSEETTNDVKGRNDRSPSFPFISLERAVERAKAFEEKHKNQPARLATAGVTWGYAPKSSGLLQTAAALKQFGLIEDIGAGADRKLVLTDLARKIILDKRPGAREQALMEAALKSRLIAEYAEKWAGNNPSEDHCISELVLDRGFNEQAARTFLKVFEETVAFANLVSGDSLSEIGPEEAAVTVPEPPVDHVGQAMAQHANRRSPHSAAPPKPPADKTTTQRSTLALREGVAAVEFPALLSAESKVRLGKWLAMMVEFADVLPEDPASS